MSRANKWTVLLLVVILMCNLTSAVLAEASSVLNLPAHLEIIDSNAFEGTTALKQVVVAEGTAEIRSRAFAGSSLLEISLPSTISFIAEDAFEGCEGLAATAPEGTYAYEWCVEHGLIAESENEPSRFLPGDVVAFKEYTKCPRCLLSIPQAVLQFYRGLDPNSKHAWIVMTGCCGTIYTCTEDAVYLLYRP